MEKKNGQYSFNTFTLFTRHLCKQKGKHTITYYYIEHDFTCFFFEKNIFSFNARADCIEVTERGAEEKEKNVMESSDIV